jgi:hypothetical protein
METKGKGGIVPRILNLDTSSRSASYLEEKSPWYQLDRRLCVPLRMSERRGVLITVISPRAQPTATRISGFNDEFSTNSVKLSAPREASSF